MHASFAKNRRIIKVVEAETEAIVTPASGKPSATSLGRISRRHSSMAQLVSESVNAGRVVHKSSSHQLQAQGHVFTEEPDTIDDMYLEEILHSGEKEQKLKQSRNVRAKLGFFRLILHDLKIWRRRWRNKQMEQPLFRKHIKNIESNFGSGTGALFVFTRWVLITNLVLSFFWLGLVVVPMSLSFSYSNITHGFAAGNIFDGQGAVGESWVFYGGYKEKVLREYYYLALAYLVMIILTYFGTLFVILKSIAETETPKSSTTLENRFKFSQILMTSWDHSVTSKEASSNLSKGIASLLKDNIYEVKAKAEADVEDKRCKILSLRILAWFITILLIGGGCCAIVFLVIYVNFTQDMSSSAAQEKTDFISVYGTTVVFSLINILVPFCIQKLPMIEKYASGKLELSITLARVFCLRMANLFALITSLYNRVTNLTYGCTGTVIGQEFYKLVVMDTILHVFAQLFMSFGKYFWTKEKAEFSISGPALVLIYRQGLIWVGTIACPVLPVIGALSNIIFFYLNYAIVIHTCKPPIKRWNQSRNTSFLTAFLLITLIFVIIPVSVVIGSHHVINLGKTSGGDCGPFGQRTPTSVYSKFRDGQSSWLQQAMTWIVSDSVLIPGFLILLAYIFYQRILLTGEKRHRVILQAELLQESEGHAELLGKMQRMPDS